MSRAISKAWSISIDAARWNVRLVCPTNSVFHLAMISAMPRAVGDMVERAHRALYRDIQRALPGAERTKVRATVLLISGCMDNQFSMDGERNGAFTAALKATWKGGRFRGDYRRFHDVILASMDPSQSPNYLVVGSPNAAFESQKPFTI